MRSALANSYNIPVVKALEYVHIYDNPETPEADGFINLARRLGITSLTRPDYGLSLTLGGGEVSLMELTGAFQVLANEGRKLEPVAITRVVNHTGDVVLNMSQARARKLSVRRMPICFLLSFQTTTRARRCLARTRP